MLFRKPPLESARTIFEKMSPAQQAEFSHWLQAHPAFKECAVTSHPSLQELEHRIKQFEQRLSTAQTREQQLLEENAGLKSNMAELHKQIVQLRQENNQLAHENHRQLPSSHPQLIPMPEDKELVVVTSQSKKFHRENCYYLLDVAPHFKTVKTKGEAITDGGRACRTCCP